MEWVAEVGLAATLAEKLAHRTRVAAAHADEDLRPQGGPDNLEAGANISKTFFRSKRNAIRML